MRAAIPLVFFSLAIWFLIGPSAAVPPIPEPVVLAEGALDPGPARAPLSDPPAVEIAGYLQTCGTCHELFESVPLPERTLLQHAHIALDHGLNDSCFNCHSLGDREKLILYDGTEIGYRDVVQLCARCHGTTFRDWERGTHGKTLGSWDASSGLQRRLECTACHDPHSPAFDPIAPLPGPNTLRMGSPSHSQSEPHVVNPLQRWSGGARHDEDE